jgi:menaquinone-dependent protoporphyrinogen oxidase
MIVLVGYASAHGSTRGIAERIAARLREGGHHVDVCPMDQVQDVGGYDAFVLGSAIHGQAWFPEAMAFVRRSRTALGARPVWLFSVGMPAALGHRWQGLAKKEEAKILAGFRGVIQPRDHRLFSGVILRGHIPLVGHLIFKAFGGRYGDFRNWPEIDAWADAIGLGLTVDTPPRVTVMAGGTRT